LELGGRSRFRERLGFIIRSVSGVVKMSASMCEEGSERKLLKVKDELEKGSGEEIILE
jgi:hypothetical protein